jgi:hypothetical protein
MARTDHGFCTVHRITYNRKLDPTCPQCIIQRMPPGEQLDFNASEQKPVDKAGTLLDAFTLEPLA